MEKPKKTRKRQVREEAIHTYNKPYGSERNLMNKKHTYNI